MRAVCRGQPGKRRGHEGKARGVEGDEALDAGGERGMAGRQRRAQPCFAHQPNGLLHDGDDPEAFAHEVLKVIFYGIGTHER